MEELKSAAGLQAALVEHGPRLAAGAMAALLAVQAGFVVTGQNRKMPAISTASASRSGTADSASASAGSSVSALRVSEIASAHLFGESLSALPAADAPQTSVQLVLAGVLAVPDPKRGLAIIGPNAGTARLYTVGSAVPGGVNLYAVYPDRVLLDRGGVIESLLLPRKIAAGSMIPTAADPLQSPGQRLAALAQGNAGLLGGLVRAQAVFAGGKLSGYRIYPGGRASVGTFTQLGLRPGDLVTAVNGTPLDDPNRANEILQTISSAASANLTVQRNGQPQDLNLNLETVANDAENAAGAAARRGVGAGGPLGGSNRLPGLGGNASPPEVVSPDDTEPPPVDEPAERLPSEQ